MRMPDQHALKPGNLLHSLFRPLVIEHAIRAVEKEFGVRVLFAGDVGSRTFGWGSFRSDLDLHFLYAHPIEWYLTIQTKKSTIEKSVKIRVPVAALLDADLHNVTTATFAPTTTTTTATTTTTTTTTTNNSKEYVGDAGGGEEEECILIEINMLGWDLKQSLIMLQKSNPSICHLLTTTSIMYDEAMPTVVTRPLREIVEKQASRRTLASAMLNLTKVNYIKYLQDKKVVRLKVYLYIVHHLLYVRSIVLRDALLAACDNNNNNNNNGMNKLLELPPMNIDELLEEDSKYFYPSSCNNNNNNNDINNKGKELPLGPLPDRVIRLTRALVNLKRRSMVSDPPSPLSSGTHGQGHGRLIWLEVYLWLLYRKASKWVFAKMRNAYIDPNAMDSILVSALLLLHPPPPPPRAIMSPPPLPPAPPLAAAAAAPGASEGQEQGQGQHHNQQ